MSVVTASAQRYSRTRGAVPIALVAALALVAVVAGMLGGKAFRSGSAPVAKPSPRSSRPAACGCSRLRAGHVRRR